MQQQAIRDHAQAMAGFFARTHRRPSWRKAGRDEGFRITQVRPGDVRRLNRSTAQVRIPKAGWVRFRWSRPVPQGVKSYRVNIDRVGRWHVAFAAIPIPVPAPGHGGVVGLDRGVAVSAALSTGELLCCPVLTARQRQRRRRLERKLARARRGSARRKQVKLAIARLRACEADRRKDWCEKTSTDLARRFDVIRVEDLKIRNMTRSARGNAGEPGRNVRQKAGLNRGILASGWRQLVRRIEDKAPSREEKVRPAYTSQRCSACAHRGGQPRGQSPVLLRHLRDADNADVNAARNIAAGHAVTARGGDGVTRPVDREPQTLYSSSKQDWVGIPPAGRGGCQASHASTRYSSSRSASGSGCSCGDRSQRAAAPDASRDGGAST